MSHPTDDPRGTARRQRGPGSGSSAWGRWQPHRRPPARRRPRCPRRTAPRRRPAAHRARPGLAGHPAATWRPRRSRAQHGHRRRGARSDHERARTACSPASKRGQVYVDMSTVSPQASRRLAERVRARRRDARRARLRQRPAGPRRNPDDHGRRRAGRVRRGRAAPAPARRTVTHVGETARAWCSSWRSTSASPYRCSPSARPAARRTRRRRPQRRRRRDEHRARSARRCSRRGRPCSSTSPTTHGSTSADAEGHPARARTAADLQIPLPSASVADQMLTRPRDLGYGHRDLAALHDVLAQSASTEAGARHA